MVGYRKKMDEQERGTKRFIAEPSRFASARSFLMVLREWNSYTPAVPVEGEHDRGGGYYLQHGGEGIVIDPGYDFLQNFRQAGGRLANIRHVVLTHAHDDHTAQFESLLMLLHQRCRSVAPTDFQAIRIYMSEGCGRKFSGLLPLKGDERVERVVPLSHGGHQMVELNSQTALTVLPAYHDDVITRDTAVGLGFTFKLAAGEVRRIVFTGDTGYYPQRTKKGDEMGKDAAVVVADEDAGVWHRYPAPFQQPDLLVAHMGSIAKEEFRGWKEVLEELGDLTDDRPPDEGHYYYPNHLGLLGMLALLDHMQPPVAIISEFGSELRGFHIELVEKLGEVFREKQKADGKPDQSFIVPGDLTMVYYLDNDTYLCHETRDERKRDDLRCVELPEWRVWRPTACDAIPPNAEPTDDTRGHLCLKGESSHAGKMHGYYVNRFMETGLPHFRGKA